MDQDRNEGSPNTDPAERNQPDGGQPPHNSNPSAQAKPRGNFRNRNRGKRWNPSNQAGRTEGKKPFHQSEPTDSTSPIGATDANMPNEQRRKSAKTPRPETPPAQQPAQNQRNNQNRGRGSNHPRRDRRDRQDQSQSTSPSLQPYDGPRKNSRSSDRSSLNEPQISEAGNPIEGKNPFPQSAERQQGVIRNQNRRRKNNRPGKPGETPRPPAANKNQNTGNPRGGPQSARRNQGSSQRNRGESQSTYVSFANSYSNPNRPAPSVPIPTDRGIKLRSQRGGMTKNWWARRWIEAMERLVDPARLQRGRSYARSGQVLTLQENNTGVESTVQGSRPAPYRVAIQVTPLTDEQWNQVVDALSEQALFTAQLLAGEMPGNIEDAFHAAGVSLFPTRSGDLDTSCSCPDWANPCKHVAATHYILGDRFDDDPFLLFRMRGRSQEQILDALRQRRGGQEMESEEAETESAPVPGIDNDLEHFWDPGEALDKFPLTISPPSYDMPLLKRLGEAAFLPGESLQAVLKPVYDSFTRSALRAAYSDEEPVEANPTEDT